MHPISESFFGNYAKKVLLRFKRLIMGEEGRHMRLKSPVSRQANTKMGAGLCNPIFTICKDPGGLHNLLRVGVSGIRTVGCQVFRAEPL